MKKITPLPEEDSTLENRVFQKPVSGQTSATVYEKKSLQESSVSSSVTKTTAETKEGLEEEYDTTKPRRIIIRARIDNGEGN